MIPYHIIRLAKGGAGISNQTGKTFFVEGALPGESGQAEVIEEKARFGRCRPVTCNPPSALRILSPTCHQACDGCGFRHVTPDAALTLKAEAIYAEILKATRLTNIPFQTLELPNHTLDGHRRRVRLHFNQTLGFFARGTHRIISAAQCPVLAPPLRAIIERLEKHLPQTNTPLEFQIDLDANDRPFLAIKPGQIAPTRPQRRPKAAAFNPKSLHLWAASLVTHGMFDGVVCGSQSFGQSQLHEAVSVENQTLITWRHVGDFAQATPLANAQIHQKLLQSLKQYPHSHVVDLFSGSGNLTFRAATQCAHVDAYECFCDPDAFQRGLTQNLPLFPKNARVQLHTFDLTKGLPKPAFEADFIICDPAREGISPQLAKDLTQSKAQILFYVSCESSSLARDITRLSPTYAPQSLTFIDMFPQTPHCETICIFVRR